MIDYYVLLLTKGSDAVKRDTKDVVVVTNKSVASYAIHNCCIAIE